MSRFHQPCGVAIAALVVMRLWLPTLAHGSSQDSAPKQSPVRVDAHGDPLPPRALFRLGTVRLRFSYPDDRGMSLSPDGKVVASGGMDSTIRFWDVATAKELRPLYLEGRIGNLLYSPDGKMIATFNGGVALWDVATGDRIKLFRGGAEAIAFSPDGKRLAAFKEFGTVRIWDVATTKELQQFDSKIEHADLRFHPDGKTLVIAPRWGFRPLELWDAATGKQLKAPGLSQVITDGRLAAGTDVASGSHSCVVWDVLTGRELHRLDTGKKVVAPLAFAPDGSKLVLVHLEKPASVAIWTLAEGQRLRRFVGDTNYASTAVFSADGAIMATTNFDQSIRLWDVKTGKQLHSFPGHTAPVGLLAFSPDGRTITSVGDNHVICQWDATGKLVRQIDRRESGEAPVALTRRLNLLVAGLAESRLMDLITGKTIGRLELDRDTTILVSPDERWVVDGLDSIRVWNVATRKLAWEKGSVHEPRGRAAGFSPDSRVLAVFERGAVQLWESATGKEIRKIAARGARALAFSPDGSTIAVAGKSIQLFKSATGELLRELDAHRDDHVLFSANGELLASIPHGDNSVAVWEVATGKKLFELHGHRSPIKSLAFSPDSRRLASGSYDTTVLIWDLSGAKDK